ncbi:acyltransferase family protein [Paenibacillus cremeus]|nr:acyltransferase [Paenibacillus cremeus]
MNGRYEELDSLRGLAALSVFFGHMYLIFNKTFLSQLLFKFGVFHFAIAGSEAVVLFFVLSGFVLSLPFYSNRQFTYSAYVIRRICRIYIPYIVAVGFAMLLRELFYTGKISGLTDWFNSSWSSDLTLSSLKDHLLLIGTFTSNLDNVVWSLVHEMRISFAFPFIMFLLVRMSWKKGIGLGITLSVLSVVYSYVTKADFIGTELYASLHYTAMFVIGALIAKYRNEISNKILHLHKKLRISLFFIGLILYLYVHPSFVLNKIVHDLHPFYRTVIDTWFVALGASILIIFAITSSRISKILRNAIVKYIGKVSFSLYLSHLVVLLSCVHFLHNRLPLWGICIVVVIVTFIISSAMYYLVEKPAISLGRRLAKSLDKSSQVKNVVNGHAKA